MPLKIPRPWDCKLVQALLELKEKHACVGDVRAQGLFAGIELVRNSKTREPLVPFNTTPALVGQIAQQFRQEGLYVYVRWNLILLAPPLILKGEELAEAMASLDKVLSWIDEQILN